MKKLEENLIELKETFDSLEFNKKDKKIEMAINNLEKELKNFREIEIYREDFTDISWSYITKNKELSSVTAYLNIVENNEL
ncbi:hypothetical protein JJC04_16530 [Flavobacterium covae]|nr:hypothetical protein [Flavobacterium covae]QYS91287.1 hypothetical protein JJC04_16530 [Flavobacterium covae]